MTSGSVEEQARSRGFAGIGGLAGRQLSNLQFDQGGERLKLQQGYGDALLDLTNAKTQAEWTKNSSMLDIQQQALYDAIQQQNFMPAAAQTDPAMPTRNMARNTVTKAMVKATKKKKGGR
jgi:hypothetical protein